MSDPVLFMVSDLAGARRRDFLDTAKRGRAVLRDADGSLLAMVPLHDLDCDRDLVDIATSVVTAIAAIASGSVRPALLGRLAWLAEFDADDQRTALDELADAFATAVAVGDSGPLHETIDAWAATARTMADPLRRAVLMTPGDDFVEVERPNVAV